MLEDIKQDNDSTSSNRSLKGSFYELTMPHSIPFTDSIPRSHTLRGSDVAEEQAYEHDPLTLYTANSPEHMLRWPIFSRVITDAEKHTRSFLLDSLDNQDQSNASNAQPPIQACIGDIQRLVRKYLHLVHRRNPVVDADKLEQYAREVTVQGLGWDGPSCQVVRFIVQVSISVQY